MAIIRPFRALRYGPDAAHALPQLVSPPGGGRRYPRVGLDGLHPYNILHIVRGRFDPENSAESTPYAATLRHFTGWKRQGILARDPREAFYILEQEFLFGDEVQVRRSLIATVLLEPLSTRNIFPHELTLRGPQSDLLDQLRALEANLSLTMGLLDDPGSQLQDLLGDCPEAWQLSDVTDGQGVRNRLFAVTHPETIRAMMAAVNGRPIVIADGHHRYETALEHQQLCQQEGTAKGTDPADHVMMMLVPTQVADRSMLPAHRVYKGLPPDWRQRLERELIRYFTIQEFSDLAQLEGFLARGQLPRWGLVQEERLLGLCRRRSQRVQRILDTQPPLWRELDITTVRTILLEQVLGICPDRYAAKDHSLYPTAAAEVMTAVRDEDYELGVLLRPVSASLVTSLACSGQVMPPKSTNFYPKPAKGLVMNSLKGF